MREVAQSMNIFRAAGTTACPAHDANLLLMAHGGLSLSVLLSTKAHLIRCNSCRARYATFAGISQSIALAIRTPFLQKWSPYRSSSVGNARHLLWLLSVLVLFGTTGIVAHFTAGASSSVDHCASVQSRSTLQPTGKCPLHSHKSLPVDSLPVHPLRASKE